MILDLITMLALVVFILEAFQILKLRVLLRPQFLLAVWRVYAVFPIARRRPCVIPGCKRERGEWNGKIWAFCSFHGGWKDPEYVKAIRDGWSTQ